MRDVKELQIEAQAKVLAERGYVGLSNKYRNVARIDRADWLQHMAARYRRAPADFFTMNSEGMTDSTGSWGAHYASVFSEDKIEGIAEEVYRRLKKLTNAWDLKYVPEEP